MFRKTLILVSLVVLFTACGSIGDRLAGTCSGFNGERDGFVMSFDQRNISLPLGEERTIVLTASWLDDDLVRRPLNCSPNRWETEPDTVVEMQGMTLRALSRGTATVRALVTGSGGTKIAEFTVTVF